MNSLPIILAAMAAFTATLSAGILAHKLQKHMGIVCAFAAGFFIALPLFDLGPNILSLSSQQSIDFYFPLATAFAGFFFLFLVNRDLPWSHSRGQGHEHKENGFRQKAGLLSTIEFCAHAFLEGMAIGLSFQLEFSLGVLVAVAVVSHDFCDGLSTLTLMLNSGNSLRSALSLLLVDALAPILGALSSFLLVNENAFLIYALSFLSGSFLYIGTMSLLPDAYRMTRRNLTAGFFLLGFTITVIFHLLIN